MRSADSRSDRSRIVARLDGRVVGPAIHHHLAEDGPDAVRLGGLERGIHGGLVDDAVGQDGRGPGRRERLGRWPGRDARRRAASAHDRSVGKVSRSSHVSRSSANPRPAFGSCGRCAWRSTIPGMSTHGRRSIAAARRRAGRSRPAPAKRSGRPRRQRSGHRPRGSVPPAASGVSSRARSANGGRSGGRQVTTGG